MQKLYLLGLSLLISACQLLPESTNTNAVYAKSGAASQLDPEQWLSLYQKYRAMTVTELQTELVALENAPASDEVVIGQVFIYLVPHSPVKNVHMGRTKLRRWLADKSAEVQQEWQLVFDLLTEATQLSERLQLNAKTHKSLLQQLEQGKVQLQQQIEQLKAIEQHINDRDISSNGN